jgi:hypothetical protein
MSGNKPKKLEWSGGLLESSSEAWAKPVTLKGEKKDVKPKPVTLSSKEILEILKLSSYVLSKEVKSRAGHPVFVLRLKKEEGPLSLKDEETLRALNEYLCKALKEKLACGGSLDEDKIILQHRDEGKIRELLKKYFLK